jgi:hypothetical protein
MTSLTRSDIGRRLAEAYLATPSSMWWAVVGDRCRAGLVP